MIFYTSDLHFGDERLNLYGRDLIASTSKEIDNLIITNWNKTVKPNDTVIVLGDCCYDKSKINVFDELNGTKILIKGNYDDAIPDETWLKYFSKVHKSANITLSNGEQCHLNHYPTKAKNNMFNIVGHIHGTWKVQRNMLNVGCDAWHFTPISEDRVIFQINGIRKHYDDNVFAGELPSNLTYTPDDKKKSILHWLSNIYK